MKQRKKVILITLRTFSLTGGIEKVCRGIAYALNQEAKMQKISFQMISFYDEEVDPRYVEPNYFKGFNGQRLKATFYTLKNCIFTDELIISHIHLAPIALMVKILNPFCKIIIWTHGIEVWRPLGFIYRLVLNLANPIIAVSQHTKNDLMKRQGLKSSQIKIISNAVDFYFSIPDLSLENNIALNYQKPVGYTLFMALTRLSATEQNKHYDRVIKALGNLKKEGYLMQYLLGGKYDQQERQRLLRLAKKSGLGEDLILTGFIEDEAIPSYYRLADAFVLPSTKEGFGIAFIEALCCGLPVIAGNQDGSVDALKDGELGNLIDPFNEQKLRLTLLKIIEGQNNEKGLVLQKKALKYYDYRIFQEKIIQLIHAH